MGTRRKRCRRLRTLALVSLFALVGPGMPGADEGRAGSDAEATPGQRRGQGKKAREDRKAPPVPRYKLHLFQIELGLESELWHRLETGRRKFRQYFDPEVNRECERILKAVSTDLDVLPEAGKSDPAPNLILKASITTPLTDKEIESILRFEQRARDLEQQTLRLQELWRETAPRYATFESGLEKAERKRRELPADPEALSETERERFRHQYLTPFLEMLGDLDQILEGLEEIPKQIERLKDHGRELSRLQAVARKIEEIRDGRAVRADTGRRSRPDPGPSAPPAPRSPAAATEVEIPPASAVISTSPREALGPPTGAGEIRGVSRSRRTHRNSPSMVEPNRAASSLASGAGRTGHEPLWLERIRWVSSFLGLLGVIVAVTGLRRVNGLLLLSAGDSPRPFLSSGDSPHP